MKSLVLLGLILAASAYKTPAYESGSESSIHWAPEPYHVLQTGNQVPRSVDVTVKFRNAFTAVPQVAIAPWLLDFAAGMPQGFIANVINVAVDCNAKTYISTKKHS